MRVLRSVYRQPLSEVNQVFSTLQSRGTDISEDIEPFKQEALATVSKSYNTFLDGIRQLIGEIRQTGIQMAVDSARLAQSTDKTSDKSFLLQTYMRDTGEILPELSLPLFVDGKHWGAFVMGFSPEVFLSDQRG